MTDDDRDRIRFGPAPGNYVAVNAVPETDEVRFVIRANGVGPELTLTAYLGDVDATTFAALIIRAVRELDENRKRSA